MKKNITYLLVGGHGSQSLMHLWLAGSKEFTHHLVFNVVDSGGHSGFLRALFADRNDLLPMGDLRNNIATWINHPILADFLNDEEISIRGKIAEILNDRTEKIEDVEESINNLIDIMRLNEEAARVVKEFTSEYVNRFNDYQGDKETKHNFGNIFLSALQLQGVDFLKTTLREANLIPENIEIYFSNNERLHLKGVDEEGMHHLGEHQVDEANAEIHPIDFQLYNSENEEFSQKDLSQELIDLVHNSDMFLIPTGSPPNTFPFLSLLSQEIGSEKPLLRLVNTTKGFADKSFEIEADYVINNLNLNALYLSPKAFSTEDLDVDFKQIIERYFAEGKNVQIASDNENKIFAVAEKLQGISDFENIINVSTRIIPAFNIIVHGYKNGGLNLSQTDYRMIVNKGFRHTPEEVSRVLSNLFELSQEQWQELRNNQFKNIENIMNEEVQDELSSEVR